MSVSRGRSSDDSGALQPAVYQEIHLKTAAAVARDQMAKIAETDVTPPVVSAAVLRMLYGRVHLKRADGSIGQKTASTAKIQQGVQHLLNWRWWYMSQHMPEWYNGILSGNPLGPRCVFDDYHREQFLQEMKAQFEADAFQVTLQERDQQEAIQKLKESKRANFLRKRKRGRWQLHLHRLPGGKNVSLAIVFTGLVTEDFIRVLQQLAHTDGAAQPVDEAERARRRKLKQEKQCAKGRWRQARTFHNRIEAGRVRLEHLQPYERQLVNGFRDDSLRLVANAAVRQHGHGAIIGEDGSFTQIGGSTKGPLREVLDDDS